MSGHSKWSKIKRQKAVNDAKKGASFTKIANSITMSAREGGGDIDTNFSLRLEVEKAKSLNMPSENIERAIKRGTGELKDAASFQEVNYEGVLAGGVAMIIVANTDNRNRTVAELRKVLEDVGGTLAESGAASWQFEKKGFIYVYLQKVSAPEKFGKSSIIEKIDKDDATLEILEIGGVEDINSINFDNEGEDEEGLIIQTSRDKVNFVAQEIKKLNYKLESIELGYIPKSKIKLEESGIIKVMDIVNRIEELDDVSRVWSNLEL